MYRIEIENNGVVEILHDMNSTYQRVASCEYTDDLYSVPSATMVVYPQNPYYNSLHEMTTLVKIINTRTNEVVFDGHILQIPDHGMQESGTISKKVICEGELGYLCDTIQLYHHYESTFTRAFLSALLDYHNSLVQSKNPERCILMGVCIPSNDNSKTTSYRSTFDEIKENVVSRLGGFIRMTRDEQGRNLLNYYSETSYGTVSNTTIELAKNMKSISVNTDATGTITRLFPLGAQVNDETGERLTISSVNGGLPYLDDAEAIQATGVIKCGTYVWDDVTLPENLLTRGQEYLSQASRVKKTFQATVLDLSTIGAEADTFKVGNTYRFINRLIGLDEYLKINKITTNIYAPYQPTIEIGDKLERITNVAAQVRRYIEYEAPKQYSLILQQARDNATALITAATTGYVVVRPDEILIMNTPSVETATRVWRWNVNGLGYAESETPGDAYKYGPFNLAMTMDGAIVADFIAAGYMYADRIRGGTLTVGGSETGGDGVISVLDDDGNEICRLDKYGASIFGTVYTKDASGNWLRLANGEMTGGYGETQHALIKANAVVMDGDTGANYTGLGLYSDAIYLGCDFFAVDGATGTTGWMTFLNDIQAEISSIEVVTNAEIVNGAISLTKETISYVSGIAWEKKSVYFHKGIMCTGLDNAGDAMNAGGGSTGKGSSGGAGSLSMTEEEAEGALPISFTSAGFGIVDYKIWGNSGGVGTQHGEEYLIPVVVTNGTQSKTTDIHISAPLMKGDYLVYSEQKIYRGGDGGGFDLGTGDDKTNGGIHTVVSGDTVTYSGTPSYACVVSLRNGIQYLGSHPNTVLVGYGDYSENGHAFKLTNGMTYTFHGDPKDCVHLLVGKLGAYVNNGSNPAKRIFDGQSFDVTNDETYCMPILFTYDTSKTYDETVTLRFGDIDVTQATLPALPSFEGTNTASVITSVQPEKMWLKYKKRG